MIANKVCYNKLVSFLFIFAASVSLMGELNKIALYIIIPAIFIFCTINYFDAFFVKEVRLLTLWLVWCFVTVLTAVNVDKSMYNFQQLLGGYMVCYICYVLPQNRKYIPWLYAAFLFQYLFMWKYAMDVGLFVINQFSDRLNDDNLNANTLCYSTFYSLISLFMIKECMNTKLMKNVMQIFIIILILFIPVVALYTASRQVIYVVAPFAILSLLLRQKMTVKNLLLLLFGMTLLFLLLNNYYESFFSNSYLQKRMELDVDDDERLKVLVEAVGVGIENLIVGVGPGNFILYSKYGIFSHCSFTELFANSGLLSLILYVYIIWRFISQQIKRHKITGNIIFFYLGMVGFFWVIYNTLFVFYINPWLFGFFFLLIGHSDAMYKESVYKPIDNL